MKIDIKMKMTTKINTKKTLVVWVAVFTATVLIVVGWNFWKTKNSLNRSGLIISQKIFTAEDIKGFGGTVEDKPIYIALDGLVYDVSLGKEFYNVSGPYHYLAGRDSSKELNIIGGSIIKKKYPVIGRFINNEK